MATDPQYYLSHFFRSRLRSALRQAKLPPQHGGRHVEFLGCTLAEFRDYCETHPNWRAANWTWADHTTKFQIDHIRPLGSFDLSDPNQLKEAVHFSNLQPLSVEDHKVKTAQDVRMIRELKKCAA